MGTLRYKTSSETPSSLSFETSHPQTSFSLYLDARVFHLGALLPVPDKRVLRRYIEFSWRWHINCVS